MKYNYCQHASKYFNNVTKSFLNVICEAQYNTRK